MDSTAWADLIEVRGFLSEPELDRLLATSRALIQPSLEEGYGLPAVEAAAAGLQVAASRTGFAPEIPVDLVTFLDPRDERSMASGSTWRCPARSPTPSSCHGRPCLTG